MMRFALTLILICGARSWAQDSSLPPPPPPPASGAQGSPPPAPEGATDPNLAGVNNQSISSQRLENEIVSFLEPYIYDAEGRRDPFKPFDLFKDADPSQAQTYDSGADDEESMAKEVTDSSPILRYNLSQLQLKAILWSVKAPKIIIADQSGTNYVLRNNDPIGNNGGYIADIREGEVLVIEQAVVQGKEVEARRYLTLGR